MRTGLLLNLTILNVCFFSSYGWDIAVAVKDRIQFLSATGHVEGNISDTMTDVSGLAYNKELSLMYFVDNKRQEGSVFELAISQGLSDGGTDGDVSAVVSKQTQRNEVKGIAYDPMTGVLYWTNGRGGAVWWLQVQTDGEAQAGQPLFPKEDMEGQIPVGLALDVCKRYLYWTNLNRQKPTIERSLLSGNERKTIVSTDLTMPNAVTLDQVTDRIYWVDEKDGMKFRIESADMNGANRLELYNGRNHQPFALAVAAGFVFWVDHVSLSVWRISLNSSREPQFVREYESSPQALVSSQVGAWKQGRCNPIIKPRTVVKPARVIPLDNSASVLKPSETLIAKNTSICLNGGTYLPTQGACSCLNGYSGALCEHNECSNYCIHGKCSPGPVCSCELGYRGERCDRDICYNFCVEGVCSVDRDGQPECRCRNNFVGQRCETKLTPHGETEENKMAINICYNYCIMGTCTVDTSGQPRCHCQDGYSGERCEVNYTQHQELRDGLRGVCKEYCLLLAESSKPSFNICSCSDFEMLTPLESKWPHDYAVTLLLAVCSIQTVAVAVLVHRVFVLRRRPRVKKRIIVSKNVTTTPMTCRPSPPAECTEITIENCCNMNICETPCYEPDFRQPEPSMSSKSNHKGIDEKKSLLGNMELPPDDLY